MSEYDLIINSCCMIVSYGMLIDKNLKLSMAVDVEFVSKETIKPSFPTPQHLRNFKLSFCDQFAPVKYTSVLFFYPSCSDGDEDDDTDDKIHHLKTSLSEILTHYYPLAGRIKDNTVIECDDGGVEFTQAKVSCVLSDDLPVSKLLPKEVWSSQAATWPLMAVQANWFACGGLVIAVCISHKTADASTMSTFMRAWSEKAQGKMLSEIMPPAYVLGDLYPAKDFLSSFRPYADVNKKSKESKASMRFVFEESKLAKLKTEAASDTVPHPSRLEALTSLVWKCLMTASRLTSGQARTSVICQNVNNRKRHTPPLPDNTFGNFLGYFAAHTDQSDCEMDLKDLVILLRKGLEDYSQFISKLHEGDAFRSICELGMKMSGFLKEGVDMYMVSSLCKFPFYEADLGWGKPKWVTIPAADQACNSIYMLDSVDGKDIEVWLNCNESFISSINCNQDLMKYARTVKSCLVC